MSESADILFPLDFRRDIDLRLDAAGRWFHEGEPFVHAGLIALFDRGIDVAPETGEPVLRVGDKWCYFRCDDTPFFVRHVSVAATGLAMTLNTGAIVEAPPATLRHSPDGVLYADFGPHRRARFVRGAQAALSDRLEDDGAAGFAVTLDAARLPVAAL